MSNITREEIIRRFKIKHDNYYDYSSVSIDNDDYLNCDIRIICPLHGEFNQKLKNHLYGKGCKKCGVIKAHKNQKSNTSEFISKANKIHDSKFDYSKTKYIDAKKKVVIICPIHGDFLQRPNDHLSGYGCNKCAIEIRTKSKYNNIKYLNIVNEVHNSRYKYPNLNIENITSDFIKIICPIHGVFEQNAYQHKRGQGCPKCNISKGEKDIELLLQKNNLKYCNQYKFKDCKYKKSLPFDFYLPDLNICIEYDGRQHFECVEIFGGEEEFKKIKLRDKIKNKYCEDNNIKLIRIKYNEDIFTKLQAVMV